MLKGEGADVQGEVGKADRCELDERTKEALTVASKSAAKPVFATFGRASRCDGALALVERARSLSTSTMSLSK